jgi:hypothetical protein
MPYGPLLTRLLSEPRLPELGAGQPDPRRKNELELEIPRAVFESGKVHDEELARACTAGLWLHFDFLMESHELSQQIHRPEGSYWHGVMHRREGDFANASYWFRRAGSLPFLADLGAAAAQLYQHDLADPTLIRLARGEAWDPFRFVDLCKACVNGNTSIEAVCRKLQRLEWNYLFGYCHAAAFATGVTFDLTVPGPFQL